MGAIAGQPLSFVGTTTTIPTQNGGTHYTTTYAPQGVSAWRRGYRTFFPPARESRRYASGVMGGGLLYWLPGANVGSGPDPMPNLASVDLGQRIIVEPTPSATFFTWVGAGYVSAGVDVANPLVTEWTDSPTQPWMGPGPPPPYMRIPAGKGTGEGPWYVPFYVPLGGAGPPAWAGAAPATLLCAGPPAKLCSGFSPAGPALIPEYDAHGQSHRKQMLPGSNGTWRWDCETHRLLYSFDALTFPGGGMCPVGEAPQDLDVWAYRVQYDSDPPPLLRWAWTDLYPDGAQTTTVEDAPAVLVLTRSGINWWKYIGTRSTGSPAVGAYMRFLTLFGAPGSPANLDINAPFAKHAKRRWSWPGYAGGDSLPGTTYVPGVAHAF